MLSPTGTSNGFPLLNPYNLQGNNPSSFNIGNLSSGAFVKDHFITLPGITADNSQFLNLASQFGFPSSAETPSLTGVPMANVAQPFQNNTFVVPMAPGGTQQSFQPLGAASIPFAQQSFPLPGATSVPFAQQGSQTSNLFLLQALLDKLAIQQQPVVVQPPAPTFSREEIEKLQKNSLMLQDLAKQEQVVRQGYAQLVQSGKKEATDKLLQEIAQLKADLVAENNRIMQKTQPDSTVPPVSTDRPVASVPVIQNQLQVTVPLAPVSNETGYTAPQEQDLLTTDLRYQALQNPNEPAPNYLGNFTPDELALKDKDKDKVDRGRSNGNGNGNGNAYGLDKNKDKDNNGKAKGKDKDKD